MAVAARAKINPTEYGKLLNQALPKVIGNEREYKHMLSEVEKLMDKGVHRSPEETALLKLMVILVQDFEDKHHPIPEAEPYQVLQHLMEEHELRPVDLAQILGLGSRGHASDIVHGRRGISKENAKTLGRYFHVSPELFL